MGVFISWSGDKSHLAAQLLRDWIPKVIQRTQCFLSSKDTGAGSVWLDTVLSQLKGSDVGIICLTKENIQNTWIHFEAGAIAKEVDKARLCPLLIDITPANVTGPLTAFQMKQFDRAGILDIFEMINSSDNNPLTRPELIESFEIRWPSVETNIAEIKSIPEATSRAVERSDREILEEILMQVRSTGTQIVEPRTRLANFKDEKAKQIAETVKEEIRKRRPLIVSWLEGADCYREGDSALMFDFPENQSMARESVSRPNNKKVLDDIGKELGIEIHITGGV
jgi:hypothetical protein